MIGWRVFFALYYLYRCVMSLLGQFVVIQFTQLGDAVRYQGVPKKFPGLSADFSWLRDSTQVTEALGVLLHRLTGGQQILINIGYQTIAFIGLYKFLMSVEPRLRRQLALLLLLPSFNIWSSVSSKEAITVFAVGVTCAYLVDTYHNTERLRPIHVLAILTLGVFKLHYMVAISFIFAIAKIGRYVRQKELLVLLSGLISLIPLYLFRDTFDELSRTVAFHFLVDAGASTRPAFWIDDYDVFWKAPEGMFLSFMGPSLGEALRSELQLIAFVESTALVGLLLFFVFRRIEGMTVFNFLLVGFAAFWVLFATYPFGIMNPGAAIRYRTGYLIVVLTIFVFLASREVFVAWRRGAPTGPSQGRTPWLRLPSRLAPRVRVTWGHGRQAPR